LLPAGKLLVTLGYKKKSAVNVMADEHMWLWGVPSSRFYAALTIFIISVGQWIFFSCLSVYLHFKRERLWLEAQQQKAEVIVKVGESKKLRAQH
jgi:hypothetical protein